MDKSFEPITAICTTNRRQWLALATSAVAGSALAQNPEKTVRLVLPNATGSGVDTITRALQPALSKALGAAVVVENQPGAGGIVGLQTLSRAQPNGATLSVVSNNVVILPSVYKKLPFDMPGDFSPITICGFTPMVLVVNPKVPASNAREFIALLQNKNNELNYASGGNGTILHLATEMLIDEVGGKALHVPYKGVGPMVTDLIGGQVQFGTAALPSVQAHIKNGTLRAIGMMTAQRVPSAADIPTFIEQGLKNFTLDAWFAVIGPKGMAATEIKHVQQAVAAAFDDPAVKESMSKQGNVINVTSTEFAQQFFKTELVKYAQLVKKAGIVLQ